MQSKRAEKTWETAHDDDLFAVADLDRTPLAVLRRRARYQLIKTGALPVVVVGRRRYVRRGAIRDFVRAQEQRLGAK